MDNKTVLITGATRGIGAALARGFAAAGYNVALGCRSAQSRDAQGLGVAADCESHGVKAVCFVADVADFAACGTMVKEAWDTMGGIDVLINNAGIARDGTVARMSEEAFDSVLNANLKSAFNMTRHISGLMMKRRTGSIINISSVVGLSGNRGQANYASSKAGMIGLTKAVARDLGSRNITCNAIAPGYIESDMTGQLPEEFKAKMLEVTTLGRFGKPEDVTGAALYLAGASYVTGQVLVVDGGLSM